ncbi:hypothetical protein [Acinetobacter boissieri]|nr:hypothetical protein [Acinetobacter boissieri]
MAKYQVMANEFPSNHSSLNSPRKCHKLRKSSGKLMYKVNLSTDNQYVLEIDNISATKHQIAQHGNSDSATESFDLSSILASLVIGKTFGSAAKLLPMLSNNNDAKFVTAVLLDLEIIKIS